MCGLFMMQSTDIKKKILEILSGHEYIGSQKKNATRMI